MEAKPYDIVAMILIAWNDATKTMLSYYKMVHQ